GSGAVAVQIVSREGRKVVDVDHVGSAHTDAELAVLMRIAAERLSPGQQALDLGALDQVVQRVDDVADWTAPNQLDGEPASTGGRPTQVAAGGQVVGTASLILWNVLADAYTHLGFDVLGDEVFKRLFIIEGVVGFGIRRLLAVIWRCSWSGSGILGRCHGGV